MLDFLLLTYFFNWKTLFKQRKLFLKTTKDEIINNKKFHLYWFQNLVDLWLETMLINLKDFLISLSCYSIFIMKLPVPRTCLSCLAYGTIFPQHWPHAPCVLQAHHVADMVLYPANNMMYEDLANPDIKSCGNLIVYI